jgi:DNA replication and repair protein RecF
LLKQNSADIHALDGFTHELIETGEKICQYRRDFIPRLSPLVRLAYRKISVEADEFRLEYKPQVKRDFAVELAQSRQIERGLRYTIVGPHRDDLILLLQDKSAADYGSEGQKRSVVIAMKMAQAEYVAAFHGTPPILLIDDVMGELDRHRRNALLPLMETSRQAQGQVFMTCTEENWPRELGRQLIRWQVNSGNLALA